MEKNQNKDENITYGHFEKSDYYVSSGRKAGDFLVGFFGVIILSILYTVIANFLSSFFSTSVWITIGFLFSIISYILLTVLFFKIGRRFIAIGIISIALVPLLLFGSCMVILMGSTGHF